MRKLLASAIIIGAMTPPTMAQQLPPSVWEQLVENIAAARACGFITQQETIGAGAGIAHYGVVGSDHAYEEALQNGVAVGVEDASKAGFCETFSAAVLIAIRNLAARNGAQ